MVSTLIMQLYKKCLIVIGACYYPCVKLFASQEGRRSVKLVNRHKNVKYYVLIGREVWSNK